jgi:hypothetical protein
VLKIFVIQTGHKVPLIFNAKMLLARNNKKAENLKAKIKEN